MKSPLKIIRYVLVVVFIAIVVAVIAFKLFGNRAVKIGIEKAASNALKVGVTLREVNLSIFGGKIGLAGLVVNNPPGYQHDRLLELNDASVTVAVKSLLGEMVHIEDLRLDGVNLVIEQKGLTNNLQEILNALPKGQANAEPSGKKLQIDNLEISNVAVNVKLLPVPGKADTVPLKLAPIKMTNLGSDSKMDVAVLSGKILVAIAEGVARQGSDILPKDMVNNMKSTFDKSLKIGEAILGTGKEAGTNAAEGVEKIGKGVTEGIKGLLKPKEKPE